MCLQEEVALASKADCICGLKNSVVPDYMSEKSYNQLLQIKAVHKVL
jgi:hypothetical protein